MSIPFGIADMDPERRTRCIAKFESFVDKKSGANACWLWTGPINGDGYYSGGYGTFSFGGKSEGAHRVAYEIAYGDSLIKAHPRWYVGHMCRDHNPSLICDCRLCVRDTHLLLVPENVDQERKRDRRIELGTVRVPGKYPDSLLWAIFENCILHGIRYVDAARTLGIPSQTVWTWLKGKSRRELLIRFLTENEICSFQEWNERTSRNLINLSVENSD